jgi:SMP-30/Gluconolactonase/LRE-like region
MEEQGSSRPELSGSRRDALKALGALGITGMLNSTALAQANAPVGTPPSVMTTPPRQWGPDSPPAKYPDEDIIVIDPSFRSALLGNTQIRRVWTGALWAEGPAWSSQGQYLVFSDVVANIQYRFSWDTRHVSAFRNPSFNSNGNSFDFQGRQLSTQDFFRRVVRWEHDGSMTIIADQFEGKPLNSPNDIVPHPDGSIWFTDPPYGTSLSEGHPDLAGGPSNPDGFFNPRLGTEGLATIGGQKRESPNGVYRWDPTGRLDLVSPKTSSRTRTDSASLRTTKRCWSAAPDAAPATPMTEARAAFLRSTFRAPRPSTGGPSSTWLSMAFALVPTAFAPIPRGESGAAPTGRSAMPACWSMIPRRS